MNGEKLHSFGIIHVHIIFQKLAKENPFELVQAQVQRFYFNNSSGESDSIVHT